MTKVIIKTPSCLSIRTFLCATPNKLHFIASVFGAFHSSCRFLSGYSETSLTTGPWVSESCWGSPRFVSLWGREGLVTEVACAMFSPTDILPIFWWQIGKGITLTLEKLSCLMESIFQRLNPKLFSEMVLAFSSVLCRVLYKAYPV